MVFQSASTNLVLELGIILAALMGWQFTLAEFVGGPSPPGPHAGRRQKLRCCKMTTIVTQIYFRIPMAVSERRVRPMDLSDPEHDARGSRPGNKAVSTSFKEDQIFNDSLIM